MAKFDTVPLAELKTRLPAKLLPLVKPPGHVEADCERMAGERVGVEPRLGVLR